MLQHLYCAGISVKNLIFPFMKRVHLNQSDFYRTLVHPKIAHLTVTVRRCRSFSERTSQIMLRLIVFKGYFPPKTNKGKIRVHVEPSAGFTIHVRHLTKHWVTGIIIKITDTTKTSIRTGVKLFFELPFLTLKPSTCVASVVVEYIRVTISAHTTCNYTQPKK